MAEKKPKSVLFVDELEELVIELGRITYKSSGISVYLPKNVVSSLHLSQKDKSLVIFSAGSNGFFLMKDTVLADSLKSAILDLRKKTLEKTDKITKII